MGEFWYPGAAVHDMRPVKDALPWTTPPGKPIVVLNHFTGNGNQSTVWPGAGRFHVPGDGVGSPFGIRKDGTVCQYVPAEEATWHAYSMSHRAVGIEYDGNPGSGGPMTEAQMEAGAHLNAWLCRTFGIPVVRSPGAAYKAGLKTHADGLQDPDLWDMGNHWDSIWQPIDMPWVTGWTRTALMRQPWTPGKFVDRVKALMAPPPPRWPGRFLRYMVPLMRGNDVALWKAELRSRDWPNIDQTDIFGTGIRDATKGFQRNHGLDDDGIVGPKTWEAAFPG